MFTHIITMALTRTHIGHAGPSAGYLCKADPHRTTKRIQRRFTSTCPMAPSPCLTPASSWHNLAHRKPKTSDFWDAEPGRQEL